MWWNLIIGVLFTVIAWLLRPKPEIPEPNTLEDFNIPVTEEGAEIPKVYGTAWLRASQVAWYGDFYVQPIREDVGKK